MSRCAKYGGHGLFAIYHLFGSIPSLGGSGLSPPASPYALSPFAPFAFFAVKGFFFSSSVFSVFSVVKGVSLPFSLCGFRGEMGLLLGFFPWGGATK